MTLSETAFSDSLRAIAGEPLGLWQHRVHTVSAQPGVTVTTTTLNLDCGGLSPPHISHANVDSAATSRSQSITVWVTAGNRTVQATFTVEQTGVRPSFVDEST